MLLYCGYAYWGAGDKDSAHTYIAESLELEPASEASLLLYMFLLEEGKRDEARSVLKRYIEADPPPAEAWTAKEMLRQEEKLEEAKEKLEKNPDDFEAAREMAEALSRSGQLDLAYEWHRKAYEMRPNDEWALRRLADFELSRNPDAAVELYKKLLAKKYDNFSRGHIMEMLGYACFSAGKFDQALSWYKKAESTDDSYGLLFFRMAECYDKMGDEEMAEKYGRKYIDYRKEADKKIRMGGMSIKK